MPGVGTWYLPGRVLVIVPRFGSGESTGSLVRIVSGDGDGEFIRELARDANEAGVAVWNCTIPGRMSVLVVEDVVIVEE